MPKNLRLTLDEVFEIQSNDSLLIETENGTERVQFGNLLFDKESFDMKGQINTNTTQLTSLSATLGDTYTDSLSTVNEYDILATYYKAASGFGDTFGGSGNGVTDLEMNFTHVLNFDLVDGLSETGVSPGLGSTASDTLTALRLTEGIYKVECNAVFSLVSPADYVVTQVFGGTSELDPGYQWEEYISQTGYVTLELFKTTAPSQTLLISNPGISPGKQASIDNSGGYGMNSVICFMYGYVVICDESEVVLRANWAGGFRIGIPDIFGIANYPLPKEEYFPIQLVFQKISDDITAFDVSPFLPPDTVL